VKEGDIAFRCNFASMKNGVIVDRRAGRIRETSELEKAINEEIDLGVEFHFRAGTSHRGALLLRGDGLSAELTGTDPHREGVPPNSARALKREGKLTAKIVNEFVSKAEKILGDHPVNKKREKEGKHPANILLLRGPGKVPPIPPFPEKWKLRTAAVCAASLIIGIARICRMDFLPTQGVTGGIDSPIERKIENVNLALKKYDFVVLNIKGADEASHDGKWDDKKKFLEKVDSALSELSRADILVITADHSSPVSLRDHSGDPVPVVISGGGVRRDNVRRYDEISCAEGGLGRIRAINLLPLLLDLAGKGEKFGE
jgi:2,3-bisphosphoglycerate-independent phosphoglycerate mutase